MSAVQWKHAYSNILFAKETLDKMMSNLLVSCVHAGCDVAVSTVLADGLTPLGVRLSSELDISLTVQGK